MVLSTSAYSHQTAREKSCDYVLIMYVKKYEIAYHNYTEAKRAHQVQKQFIQTVCSVKTTAYDQNKNIK